MSSFLSSVAIASAVVALSAFPVQVSASAPPPAPRVVLLENNGTKSWADAEAFCQSTYSTHLATVYSANDINDIMGGAATNVWVGLNDQITEGTFVWASGAPLASTHTPWKSGEPVTSTSDNCVVVASSEFQTVPCSSTFSFACDLSNPTASPTKAPVTPAPIAIPTKAPVTSLPTKAPVTSSPTKAPVTSVPTKNPTPPTGNPTKSPTAPTLKVPTNAPTKAPTTLSPTLAPDQIVTLRIIKNAGKKSWNNATEYCIKTYNTSLATVRTPADQKALDDANDFIWIGLNDIDVESNNDKSKFVWASGEPYNVSLAYWTNGKDPNGGKSENCVANFAVNKYHWVDFECYNEIFFACDTMGGVTTTRSTDKAPSSGSSFANPNASIGIVSAIFMIIFSIIMM